MKIHYKHDKIVDKERRKLGERHIFIIYRIMGKREVGQLSIIDLIVSFLMESGVKMLLPQLKQAQKRGVPIRILTGNMSCMILKCLMK